MITALIAGVAAVLGALLARSIDLASYFQSNAKAHSDVESLKRELTKLEARFAKLEAQVDQLNKDNSSLTEQNRVLILQNNELHLQNQKLTQQNGYLIGLLGDDMDEDSE